VENIFFSLKNLKIDDEKPKKKQLFSFLVLSGVKIIECNSNEFKKIVKLYMWRYNIKSRWKYCLHFVVGSIFLRIEVFNFFFFFF
jgi:hypothetical protein